MEDAPTPPIITLLTDFGSTDAFVGSVKGVILDINPHVTVIDITHEITPFSIVEAALVLESAYSYFPKKTIHLAIVDPGVGSNRRPLLVSAGGFFFVAPDNGLLSTIFARFPNYIMIELTEKAFHRPAPGNTFHARDLFAPVAASLSTGIPLEAFGIPIDTPVTIQFPPVLKQNGMLLGEVMYVDRFGNLMTNLTVQDIGALGQQEELKINIGNYCCDGIVRCYAEGSRDAPGVLINSSGHLEIFVYCGNAAKQLPAEIGSAITVTDAG